MPPGPPPPSQPLPLAPFAWPLFAFPALPLPHHAFTCPCPLFCPHACDLPVHCILYYLALALPYLTFACTPWRRGFPLCLACSCTCLPACPLLALAFTRPALPLCSLPRSVPSHMPLLVLFCLVSSSVVPFRVRAGSLSHCIHSSLFYLCLTTTMQPFPLPLITRVVVLRLRPCNLYSGVASLWLTNLTGAFHTSACWFEPSITLHSHTAAYQHAHIIPTLPPPPPYDLYGLPFPQFSCLLWLLTAISTYPLPTTALRLLVVSALLPLVWFFSALYLLQYLCTITPCLLPLTLLPSYQHTFLALPWLYAALYTLFTPPFSYGLVLLYTTTQYHPS